MTIIGCRTTTYKVQDEIYIDIVETDDMYEAWIYEKDSGEKMLMFGCSKAQQPEEEFLEIVEGNAEEYFDIYKGEQVLIDSAIEALEVYREGHNGIKD